MLGMLAGWLVLVYLVLALPFLSFALPLVKMPLTIGMSSVFRSVSAVVFKIVLSVMFAMKGALFMRKIKSLCKRIRRERGWWYCCTSSRRGHYALYRFSGQIDDWFWVRSFSSVGQCLDYLTPFVERN